MADQRTVAVAGASGYAGGELLRLIEAHPGLRLGPVAAHGSAGALVSTVHPQLASLAGRRFSGLVPDELASADAVLIALPHGHSADLVAKLPPELPVVDLGADHRLADAADWARYYPGPHAGAFAYGLPELPGARRQLTGARRVAVPGCHATAVLLALHPLVRAGLVSAEDLAVVSTTGTSGAGREPGAALTSAQVMGDAAAYKAGRHQHTAEIAQALGPDARLSLTPVLAPMPRGILAVCTARPTASESQLREAVAAAYADEPFVTLLDDGCWPHTGATLGSNSVHLQLAVDDHAGRVIVVAALDNLVKGAAGQALQCLNLALGLGEATGLPVNGLAP